MHRALTASDCYFFEADTQRKLCINVDVLKSANAAASRTATDPRSMVQYAREAREARDGKTYTPLSSDTIMQGFLEPENDDEDVMPKYEQEIARSND